MTDDNSAASVGTFDAGFAGDVVACSDADLRGRSDYSPKYLKEQDVSITYGKTDACALH